MKREAHATPKEARRFYRYEHRTGSSFAFEVKYRETDLWIRAEKDLGKEAMDAVLNYRRHLELYISKYPNFRTSLAPLPDDPLAPSIVRRMLAAAQEAGVGPMASVAGAISEFVAKDLRPLSRTVVVENGGDCYLDLDEEVIIGVYAGPDSPFKSRIALRFGMDRFPLGICTSSGTVGHSLSLGRADAVTVVSKDTAAADAAATALGNVVQKPSDIGKALELAAQIPSVEGVLILIADRMGAWGNMELVSPGR